MSSACTAIFPRRQIRREDAISIPAVLTSCLPAAKIIRRQAHSVQRIRHTVIFIRRTRIQQNPKHTHKDIPMVGQEVARRRTFAIISHPDAGKTTLTEKLLLFAGAIHIAGSVKARKASRHATSDWMEIEKQRGIS